MSNSLDPDQALHSVRPGLCPNYLQKLSADDTIVGKELSFELLKVRIVGNCSASTHLTMGSSVFCLYSHLLDIAKENWQQQSPVAQLVE